MDSIVFQTDNLQLAGKQPSNNMEIDSSASGDDCSCQDSNVSILFVFSDMEFDDASTKYGFKSDVEGQEVKRSWETDYEAIVRKFKEKGYNTVPEIVFWNLRHSRSTPVVSKQSGVALVSGFSKNLLSLFLEEGGVVSPEDVMTLAISGNEYKNLVVYD